MVPFRVLCAIRTWLQSRWWFRCTFLLIQLFASRAMSRCKHDMGTLLWLNAEALEISECKGSSNTITRILYDVNIREQLIWAIFECTILHHHTVATFYPKNSASRGNEPGWVTTSMTPSNANTASTTAYATTAYYVKDWLLIVTLDPLPVLYLRKVCVHALSVL